MPSVDDVAKLLEEFAPLELAEDWDNVGLLVGDRSRPVARVMTCLTLTPATVAEAVGERVDLVVTHHPLPFHPFTRITTDTVEGRMLLELAAAHVAVYSPHTAFDSARSGINQRLAEGLGLAGIEPLTSGSEGGATIGAGRCGTLDPPLSPTEFSVRVKTFLRLDSVRVAGDQNQSLHRVAVACGSGGSFLTAAHERGCDCLVTGEASFHACWQAEAMNVCLLLVGHYASERFGVEFLADHLKQQATGVEIWASRRERDPLRNV